MLVYVLLIIFFFAWWKNVQLFVLLIGWFVLLHLRISVFHRHLCSTFSWFINYCLTSSEQYFIFNLFFLFQKRVVHPIFDIFRFIRFICIYTYYVSLILRIRSLQLNKTNQLTWSWQGRNPAKWKSVSIFGILIFICCL